MRLLWARALDDMRTAIVIDQCEGGSLIGGVVVLAEFTINMPYTHHPDFRFRGTFNGTLEMRFHWEWWRNVTSPEDFEQSREWERPREIEKPTLQLESKKELK